MSFSTVTKNNLSSLIKFAYFDNLQFSYTQNTAIQKERKIPTSSSH